MTDTRRELRKAHRYAQSLDDAIRIAHAGADPVTELVLRDLIVSATGLRYQLSALLSALRERDVAVSR